MICLTKSDGGSLEVCQSVAAALYSGSKGRGSVRRLGHWLGQRGFGFWLVTTVLGGVIAWGVSQAMPALWREVTRPEPVAVNVQPSPKGVTGPPSSGTTTAKHQESGKRDESEPPESPDSEEPRSDARLAVEADPKVFQRGAPDWTDYSYVIPLDMDQVPPPPEGLCRGRRAWAYGLGGADAVYTVAQVTVRGQARGTVLIDGIEVDMLERRRPIRGTWARCPVGGADASPRMVQINLDRDPARVQYFEEGGDPVEELSFTLMPGEVEFFQIWAWTQDCYCEWRLKLLLVDGGERREVLVDDNGEPFRTTASNRAVSAAWGQAAWEPWSSP